MGVRSSSLIVGPDPNPCQQCFPQGEAGDLFGRMWQVGEG